MVRLTTEDKKEMTGLCIGGTRFEQLLGGGKEDKDVKVKELHMVHILNQKNEMVGVPLLKIKSLNILDSKISDDFTHFLKNQTKKKQDNTRSITLSCHGKGRRGIEASFVGKGFEWVSQYRFNFADSAQTWEKAPLWQYLVDDQWKNFDEKDQNALEKMYFSRKKSLVPVVGGDRLVDVVSKIQLHKTTSKTKLVQRRSPSSIWIGTDGFRIYYLADKKCWVSENLEGERKQYDFKEKDEKSGDVFLKCDGSVLKLTSKSMDQLDEKTKKWKSLRYGVWSDNSETKVVLQCLASIRNPTNDDWENVELSLISGNIQFLDGDISSGSGPSKSPVRHYKSKGKKMKRKKVKKKYSRRRDRGYNKMTNRMIADDSSEEDFDDLSGSDTEDEWEEIEKAKNKDQMAVSSSKDDDMTTFRIRKPVSLDRNRAGLVEMFEKPLISGRKLVVVGMEMDNLTSLETKLGCKSGIFLLNHTGYVLESGLSCVMNGQSGLYMGEGFYQNKTKWFSDRYVCY
eukprot:UN30051